MTCYHPLRAWKGKWKNPETGKRPYVFDYKQANNKELVEQLPCGQCIGCKLDLSKMWGARMMHETHFHDKSSFLTLTYTDDNVPLTDNGQMTLQSGNGNKSDIQKFIKRIRKAGIKCKYYQAGEYGDQFGRPHHHVCLFGYDFPILREITGKTETGHYIYKSDELDDFWQKGNAYIGELTFQSAAYVARYCLKKVTGGNNERFWRRYGCENAEDYYCGRVPEWNSMSNGIGQEYYKKYKKDLYNYDICVVGEGGKSTKMPRYYDTLHEKEITEKEAKEIKSKRRRRAARHRRLDGTPERLAVREFIKKRQNEYLRRDYDGFREKNKSFFDI